MKIEHSALRIDSPKAQSVALVARHESGCGLFGFAPGNFTLIESFGQI